MLTNLHSGRLGASIATIQQAELPASLASPTL
jgi:hypothetical protein